MAIYDGVSGKRRGSVGNETYTLTRGLNVVKAKVIDPTNPRSTAQQTQRASFASAIRFYQLATRNFFKFAYESQRQRESDFNAFMRFNAKKSVVVPPYNAETNPDYPLVGNWKMSQGSLAFVPVVRAGGSAGHFTFTAQIKREGDYSGYAVPTTVAQLSKALVDEAGLQYGDILTIPYWYAMGQYNAGSVMLAQQQENRFGYAQFILSTSDTTALTDLEGYSVQILATANSLIINFEVETDLVSAVSIGEFVGAATMILSRLNGNNLLVSDAEMVMSSGANALWGLLSEPGVRDANLRLWGAQGTAILKGGKG